MCHYFTNDSGWMVMFASQMSNGWERITPIYNINFPFVELNEKILYKRAKGDFIKSNCIVESYKALNFITNGEEKLSGFVKSVCKYDWKLIIVLIIIIVIMIILAYHIVYNSEFVKLFSFFGIDEKKDVVK